MSLLSVTGCALGWTTSYILPFEFVHFSLSLFVAACYAASSLSTLSVTLSSHSLSQGERKLRERLCYLHAKRKPRLSPKNESHPAQLGHD